MICSTHFTRAFNRWAGVTPREYRSHLVEKLEEAVQAAFRPARKSSSAAPPTR
jgi:AraC-like DNA-binding protein